MKKNNYKLSIPFKWWEKTLLIMKLALCLICVSVLSLSGYSQNTRMSLSLENVSVAEVLKKIQQQTDFKFFYNDELINRQGKVTVKAVNKTLEEILDEALASTKLVYRIVDKTIFISEAENLPPSQVEGKAQQKIQGRVTDEKGNPLPGATVLIKGKFKGTTTDAKGNYAIKVPEGSVLVFSFVGFHKQEVVVSSEDTEINVVMEQKAAELEEFTVISTGYQKIKPEQSTGSIATMQVKEYNSRINTTDFLTSLANRIPGLLINNDVEFEGNSLFQIRGISTINGGKQPLIVVDGYPTELSLDMINPNEIESVTVLKDAAAATIYGARSSNGVIIIERKKAKAGKVNVSFRSTLGFTPKENYDRYRWDKDASATTIDYYRDTHNFSASTWSMHVIGTFASMTNYPAPGLIMAQKAAGIIDSTQCVQQLAELASYNNTKDYGRLFLRTAVTQTYNLDISGGNEKALYYITANYTDNAASQIKNGNSRFMLSGRSTIKFSERFSLDLTTDIQQSKTTSVPIPDITRFSPYERFQDEEGNPLPTYSGSVINPYYNEVIMEKGYLDNLYYPLQEINEVSTKTSTVNNRITANFLYNIGNGFTLKFGGVYETSRTDSRYLASENSSAFRQLYNNYRVVEGGSGIPPIPLPGAPPVEEEFISYLPLGSFLRQTNSSRKSYTLRAQLNYDKQIHENHSLNLIFGGEMRDVLDKSNIASYFGYNDQTLLHQGIDCKSIFFDNSFSTSSYFMSNPTLSFEGLFDQGYTDDRYVSIYSNIVYSYKGKYSATGSIRIDQSNLFGTNPKYKYKPLWSVGAAWNIHKEKFMQNMEWLKSLKLRVAYGFNGNVAKNVLPQVIAYSGYNSMPAEIVPSLSLTSHANSGLRWEQTRNYNIGLDYSIFKNISGTIDYYIKKSTDILANNQIDATKGGNSAMINQASIRNSGLEISLHADWINRKNFNWNTGLIFSYNKSKVLKVYHDALNVDLGYLFFYSDYTNYLDGYPVGTIFNYRYAGIDSNGRALIYDENGEAKEFSPYDTSAGDVEYAGTTIPSVNIGFSNRVDIGNFYVYCMVNYYGGFKTRIPVPNPGAIRPLKGAGNYWKEPGDEADPNILPSPEFQYYSNLESTDRYIVNGAYLTLGDLTASYSFRNSKWVKKAGISNFELRLQGSNLYTVGLNKYNYSKATGIYDKSYLTPTYTIGLYVNF